ncbi:MAG: hypothetical protein Q9160_008765 [Pyrenula sp. 1 TL-2023]
MAKKKQNKGKQVRIQTPTPPARTPSNGSPSRSPERSPDRSPSRSPSVQEIDPPVARVAPIRSADVRQNLRPGEIHQHRRKRGDLVETFHHTVNPLEAPSEDAQQADSEFARAYRTVCQALNYTPVPFFTTAVNNPNISRIVITLERRGQEQTSAPPPRVPSSRCQTTRRSPPEEQFKVRKSAQKRSTKHKVPYARKLTTLRSGLQLGGSPSPEASPPPQPQPPPQRSSPPPGQPRTPPNKPWSPRTPRSFPHKNHVEIPNPINATDPPIKTHRPNKFTYETLKAINKKIKLRRQPRPPRIVRQATEQRDNERVSSHYQIQEGKAAYGGSPTLNTRAVRGLLGLEGGRPPPAEPPTDGPSEPPTEPPAEPEQPTTSSRPLGPPLAIGYGPLDRPDPPNEPGPSQQPQPPPPSSPHLLDPSRDPLDPPHIPGYTGDYILPPNELVQLDRPHYILPPSELGQLGRPQDGESDPETETPPPYQPRRDPFRVIFQDELREIHGQEWRPRTPPFTNDLYMTHPEHSEGEDSDGLGLSPGDYPPDEDEPPSLTSQKATPGSSSAAAAGRRSPQYEPSPETEREREERQRQKGKGKGKEPQRPALESEPEPEPEPEDDDPLAQLLQQEHEEVMQAARARAERVRRREEQRRRRRADGGSGDRSQGRTSPSGSRPRPRPRPPPAVSPTHPVSPRTAEEDRLAWENLQILLATQQQQPPQPQQGQGQEGTFVSETEIASFGPSQGQWQAAGSSQQQQQQGQGASSQSLTEVQTFSTAQKGEEEDEDLEQTTDGSDNHVGSMTLGQIATDQIQVANYHMGGRYARRIRELLPSEFVDLWKHPADFQRYVMAGVPDSQRESEEEGPSKDKERESSKEEEDDDDNGDDRGDDGGDGGRGGGGDDNNNGEGEQAEKEGDDQGEEEPPPPGLEHDRPPPRSPPRPTPPSQRRHEQAQRPGAIHFDLSAPAGTRHNPGYITRRGEFRFGRSPTPPSPSRYQIPTVARAGIPERQRMIDAHNVERRGDWIPTDWPEEHRVAEAERLRIVARNIYERSHYPVDEREMQLRPPPGEEVLAERRRVRLAEDERRRRERRERGRVPYREMAQRARDRAERERMSPRSRARLMNEARAYDRSAELQEVERRGQE